MIVERDATNYIAHKCGLRPEAVAAFLRSEHLSPIDATAAIGLKRIDPGDFVAAVVGLPGNLILRGVVEVIRGWSWGPLTPS